MSKYTEIAAKIRRLEECKRERGVVMKRLGYITEHEGLPMGELRRNGLMALKRNAINERNRIQKEMDGLCEELKRAGIDA